MNQNPNQNPEQKPNSGKQPQENKPNNNQNPNNKDNRPQQSFKKPNFFIFFVIIMVVLGIWLFSSSLFSSNNTVSWTATEFDQNFGAVESMNITPLEDNPGLYKVSGSIKGSKNTYVVVLFEEQLMNYWDKAQSGEYHVVINTVPLKRNMFLTVILSLLPYIILGVLFFFLLRSSSQGNNKAFDFGKNRAKLMREKTKNFNDVAGCDEEKMELAEMVDFLKNPKKYTRLGARIPKGVLLVGPPGTGKTLLAKAVAGEASVPFFSISGSDFVEMFVGVGASRVRDLFKVAKENAPCIIFIDEIDAVGRQRGAGMGGGHDEREQTLNQLLVEMDGFANNSGIIMIAATNRPDVLDPALLRPGRFDRQITINNPDLKGREAILKVHARGKFFEDNVKFDEIAQRIPGFSGADIENLLNEAALLVARSNRERITMADIDEAIDRVMMGPAKKSKKYTEKEKKLVAYHESGHAIIGLKLEHASEVQKITIIPRGQAGGYNLMMPKEETYYQTKKDLYDTITGYLGGRTAEEIIFNEISTGAYSDIKSATKIARAMVAEYGMSDLGPIQYEEQQGSVFLGRDYLKDKNFSDTVAHEIDAEVRKIIFECHDLARKVIEENLPLLHKLAGYLLELETLTKSDIEEINRTGELGWFEAEKKKKAEEKAKESLEPKKEEKPETPVAPEKPETSSTTDKPEVIDLTDKDVKE